MHHKKGSRTLRPCVSGTFEMKGTSKSDPSGEEISSLKVRDHRGGNQDLKKLLEKRIRTARTNIGLQLHPRVVGASGKGISFLRSKHWPLKSSALCRHCEVGNLPSRMSYNTKS